MGGAPKKYTSLIGFIFHYTKIEIGGLYFEWTYLHFETLKINCKDATITILSSIV